MSTQIKRLRLAQFRAFQQVDFEFEPGMNLIVGVNGAGKSSVLDALRMMMAQTWHHFTAAQLLAGDPFIALGFSDDDITVGRDALTAELWFNASDIDFYYLVQKPRDEYAANTADQRDADSFDQRDMDMVRDNDSVRDVDTEIDSEEMGVRNVRTHGLRQSEIRELSPTPGSISPKLKQSDTQPLGVYFSARRSLLTGAPLSGRKARGQSIAFTDAFEHRNLDFRDFTSWIRALEEGVVKNSERRLSIIQDVIHKFLPNYSNLHTEMESRRNTLKISRNDGPALKISQLSDGERGILSLIIDLVRRLTLANPKIDNALADGEAIVLIDELDLHLHPIWQREVVHNLLDTFPKCQFIATTHSPQIIGEVKAEKIILLENGVVLDPPHQAKGMDSNWILRHIMGADERNPDVKEELERISALITSKNFAEATQAIRNIRSKYGVFPEIVQLQTIIDRIQLLGK